MKRALLFGTVAAMVTVYACKKDEKIVTVTNTVHDTTKTTIIKTDTVIVFASGKINADTLTSGITVAYGGDGITGEFPVASTDAAGPVLDTTYKRTYRVVKSRYLTIYPPHVSGYVAGYYVEIAGAKTYFKVDYPAAVAARKAARQARAARIAKATNARQVVNARDEEGEGEGDGEDQGFIDSTLVIKLPASVRGDTFYVKYAAYDLQNRVSAAITATAVILPSGNAAFTESLTGSWSRYEYRGISRGVANDWQVDTGSVSMTYYNCNNDKLMRAFTVTSYFLPINIYSYKNIYNFDMYNMTYTSSQVNSEIDLNLSSCSNQVYAPYYSYSYDRYGGYSYDAASKMITFIYDGDNLDYESYKVDEVTSSYIILSSENGENNNDNYRYQYKYIKQ